MTVKLPDSIGEGPPNSTYCFLNRERVCGGDCEAFDPAGGDHDRTCLLINAMHRASMSLITIARVYQSSQPMSGADVRPPGV
jgi:hypothetical protein